MDSLTQEQLDQRQAEAARNGLAKDAGNKKYDAQVRAGLIEDPSRLRQLEREADAADKKPTKK